MYSSEQFIKSLAGVNSRQVEILVGRQGLIELCKRKNIDIVLNGLVGAAGMEPTLYAIESGVNVAHK